MTELFPILNQPAMYLDQRTLGDENRYIIERQLQEHPVGIIMEKPTVILKKNYIQDTKFEEEKLSAGTEYKKEVQVVREQVMHMMDLEEKCDNIKLESRSFAKKSMRSRRAADDAYVAYEHY